MPLEGTADIAIWLTTSWGFLGGSEGMPAKLDVLANGTRCPRRCRT
jgi:hypothetical protein